MGKRKRVAVWVLEWRTPSGSYAGVRIFDTGREAKRERRQYKANGAKCRVWSMTSKG